MEKTGSQSETLAQMKKNPQRRGSEVSTPLGKQKTYARQMSHSLLFEIADELKSRQQQSRRTVAFNKSNPSHSFFNNNSRSISNHRQKYTLLNEQQYTKVVNVFQRIFGSSFKGYKNHIQKLLLHSSFKSQTFHEVTNEVSTINSTMINNIIQGMSQEDEERRFSPPKANRKVSPSEQQSKYLPSFNQPKLTPEQQRKRNFQLSIMRQRMEDCQEELLEAQDLIRKLKREKKDRIERMKQKMIEVEQLQQDEAQDALRKRIEDEERKKKEIEVRREQIRSKMELVRENREKQKREWFMKNRNANSESRRVLYKEWEGKFKEEVEMKALNERKRILEQIRNFKKPISREEFEEHAKKYEDEKEKKIELRLKEREKKVQEHEDKYDVDKFRTKTYQEVALYDLQQKEERETREEMKRLLIEKKESYAKYVREMHLPPKSKQKEEELKELIEQLRHPVRSQVKYPPGTNLDAMKTVQSAKNQQHTRNASIKEEEQSPGSDDEKHHSSKRKSFFKPYKPPLPHQDDRNLLKPKTDYLKERRMKREMQQDRENRQDWNYHLQNKRLSKKEKFLKIKEKAREIEEMALRKEQLLQVKGGDKLGATHGAGGIHGGGGGGMLGRGDEKNIDETLEVNDMLIDAIKAKLAILDNIN